MKIYVKKDGTKFKGVVETEVTGGDGTFTDRNNFPGHKTPIGAAKACLRYAQHELVKSIIFEKGIIVEDNTD